MKYLFCSKYRVLKTHKIQELNHDDEEVSKRIWKIFQRSYQIEADLVGVEDFPPLKRTAENLRESNTRFFGIEKNEKLAGLIEIDLSTNLLDICSLVVDPDFFRQGMAGFLIDFVLRNFKRNVSLVETAAANKPAIKLYEGKGFAWHEQWMTPFEIEKVKLIRES